MEKISVALYVKHLENIQPHCSLGLPTNFLQEKHYWFHHPFLLTPHSQRNLYAFPEYQEEISFTPCGTVLLGVIFQEVGFAFQTSRNICEYSPMSLPTFF